MKADQLVRKGLKLNERYWVKMMRENPVLELL